MAFKSLKKTSFALSLIASASLLSVVGQAHANSFANPYPVNQPPENSNPNRANLGGEIHASVHENQFADSDMVMNPAMARLDDAMGSAVVAAPNATKILKGKASVWSQISGHFGHTYAGGAARMATNYGGFVTGMDTKVSGWLAGGTISYGRAMNWIHAGRDSSAYSNNVGVGLYAGRKWGNFGLKLGATYAFNIMGQSRNTNVAGLPQQHLTSHYLGGVANAKAVVNYTFHPFDGSHHAFFHNVAFSPFLGAEYINANTNATTERGGSLALRAKHYDKGMTFGSVGFAAGTSFKAWGITWSPAVSANYQHEFGENTTQNILSFAHSNADTASALTAMHMQGANSWRTGGSKVSRTVAYTTAGFGAKVDDHWSANASYFGGYGSEAIWTGGTVGFSYAF